MVDYVSESLLYIRYSFSLFHLELLILLNQGMFLCSLNIIDSIMSHFKNLPHFLGTLALWNMKKLIHVERWSEDILCIAIILSHVSFCNFFNFFNFFLIILSTPPFFLSPFSPWLINLHIFNSMLRSIWSIYDCISYPLIYWLNKDFHPYFPKLVINATKHRGSMKG